MHKMQALRNCPLITDVGNSGSPCACQVTQSVDRPAMQTGADMLESDERKSETSQIERSFTGQDLAPTNVISFPSPPNRSGAPYTSSRHRVSSRCEGEEGDLWLRGLTAAILIGAVGLLYCALFAVIMPRATIFPFAW